MFPKLYRYLKAQVCRMIQYPSVSIEEIKTAFNRLPEEDRKRMPYVTRLIALES